MKSVQTTATADQSSLLIPLMAPGGAEDEVAIGYEAGSVPAAVINDELSHLLSEFDEECLRERESAEQCDCEACDGAWMLIF